MQCRYHYCLSMLCLSSGRPIPPAAHSRVVSTLPHVPIILSQCHIPVAFARSQAIHPLHLSLQECILICHVPLQFLESLKTLVVSHLLSHIDCAKTVTVLHKKELHAAKVSQDNHRFERIVSGCHMQNSVSISPVKEL